MFNTDLVMWLHAWRYQDITWNHVGLSSIWSVIRSRGIYIIIAKNIRYLLWNRGFWRSLNNYQPNIFDPVYSVHQSFMWFLWLNWRKSTSYPVTAPDYSKCWPNVTSLFVKKHVWFAQSFSESKKKSFSESVEPWNVWQVTSWLTGQGKRARHEVSPRTCWLVSRARRARTWHGYDKI